MLSRIAVCTFLVFGCTSPDEIEDPVGPAADEGSPGSPDSAASLSDVQWVMRHQMTAATYLTEKAKWEETYEPKDISAYQLDGRAYYAAIWEKGLPPRLANHSVVSAQALDTLVANQKALKYRLVHLEPYEVSGQPRWAVIFEQTSNPIDQRYSSKLPAADFQTEYITNLAAGYRLLTIEGYTLGGIEHYATLYEKAAGPVQRPGDSMTLTEYKDAFDANGKDGYRLTHISAYKVGSADQYAAIWEKTSGPGYTTTTMTAKELQHNTIDYYLQGYHPTQIDGFLSSGNDDKYVPIFEVQPNAQQGSYCRNGYCFDLDTLANKLATAVDGANIKWGLEVRRGLQVIQKRDGVNRTFLDPPETGDFTVHDRFNPASVGKSITAIALLKLMNEQGIGLNTPIWTFLPATWVIPVENQTITFAEILGHRSGLRDVSGAWEYGFAKVEQYMETAITAPKTSSYENINYGVARVLVSRLAGENWALGGDGVTRFINYVNNTILAPLGIYNALYKSTGNPTLFYPIPQVGNGTDYGDWTANAGVAGPHLTIHELAVFAQATFAGLIVPTTILSAIKAQAAANRFGIGWGDRGPDGIMSGAYPDGTTCWGKGGNFPGPRFLNTEIVACDNGLSVMVMGNDDFNVEAAFMAAMKESFTPE